MRLGPMPAGLIVAAMKSDSPSAPLPLSLPLAAAILRWSEPHLVEAVKAEEQRLTEHELSLLPDRPRLSALGDLRQPTTNDWMGGGPNFLRLIAAWQALERDLKAKLAGGALRMTGVQMAPVRQVDRTTIPGVWATDCRLDLLNCAITIGDARYVAVVVAAADTETEAPVAVSEAEAETAATIVEQPRRTPGRKNGVPVIEAAVMRHWEHVQQLMQPTGSPPVVAEVARSLHKRMEADAQKGIVKKRVAGETVRKHLREIYERVLGEKAREM